MPPIGDTLREARMRQRLDIVDVEERTKIRAKYLRALENEEWALLPGPTFVRTFLRTYAEAVGLDPQALVDAYRSEHGGGDEGEAPQPMAPAPRRRPARSSRPARPNRSSDRRRPPRPAGPTGPPGPAAVFGGAVVLVIVALLLLGLLGGDDENPDGPTARETTTTRTQTTAKKPAPKPKPKPAPTGVTVRVQPEAPTYVCMDAGDGKPRVFEGILEEARTFKNASELRLNLGKRAVKVTANGKPVTIAPSGDPIGLRVTRTGASEITDGPRPCA